MMTAEAGGGRVLYLYGVVPRDQPLPPSGAACLEAVTYSSIVGVVESVPAREFSAEALERSLQLPDWVAPLARKHSAVLSGVMQHGPVVPARLCTLFSTPEALVSLLAENEQRFRDTLCLLDGREEWGLKVFCHEATLRSVAGAGDAKVRALEEAAAAASLGQAFVLRKQRDHRLAEVASTRTEAVLDEMLDGLAPFAADICLRPLLSEAAAGRREPMVLNAALLVDIAATAALGSAAEELASRFRSEGFAVQLTGPWPPYSFCEEGDGEPDGGDESSTEEAD